VASQLPRLVPYTACVGLGEKPDVYHCGTSVHDFEVAIQDFYRLIDPLPDHAAKCIATRGDPICY